MAEREGAQIRVAFVDDDERLLDGLRRMLRRKRREWEMVFAPKPVEFVERLRAERFDVVVSDMRMPELNGVGVLRAVLERNPGATRLVLTGQAHARSWLELIGPGQRVLAKPCEADALEAAIEQAHLLTRQIGDKLDEVSAPREAPPLWAALMEGLQCELPESELEALVLEPCPASAALALSLTGEPQEPGGLRPSLGAALLPVVLGVRALEHCGCCEGPEFEGALRVAARAVAIAAAEHAEPVLLQQSALAAVLQALPCALEASEDVDGTAAQDLRRTLHAWGLPDVVCEAAVHCRTPGSSLLRGPSALPYVHAAWAIERRASGGDPAALDRAFLEGAGVGPAGWEELDLPWRAVAAAR